MVQVDSCALTRVRYFLSQALVSLADFMIDVVYCSKLNVLVSLTVSFPNFCLFSSLFFLLWKPGEMTYLLATCWGPGL